MKVTIKLPLLKALAAMFNVIRNGGLTLEIDGTPKHGKVKLNSSDVNILPYVTMTTNSVEPNLFPPLLLPKNPYENKIITTRKVS
jgi:hypothetical protein